MNEMLLTGMFRTSRKFGGCRNYIYCSCEDTVIEIVKEFCYEYDVGL